MKLILSGYGKMGFHIEEKALETGNTVCAVVDTSSEGKSRCGIPFFKSIADVPPDDAEGSIVVDFTRPDAAVENIITAAGRGLSVLVGTTGWYDRLDEVRKVVAEKKIALLYAANFSIGVNLFYKIVAEAAALFDKFEEFDVGGFEMHHNRKADSPSGTAKTLAGHVLSRMTRKKRVVYDKLNAPPKEDELHFASLRVGGQPGMHGIVFDSGADSIEINHIARSRDAFVSGAMNAAVWLDRKIRSGARGVFTLEDVLNDAL